KEVVLIAKTKEHLVPELIDKVKSVHSYSCPCVVSVPIVEGNKPFLKWVEEETK
ncbi:MAG: divalent-cation tolerance protein CutA, partial [Desulfobacteraceae bacterium]|nr:divalent-cation tolerance protein CutA [Desulfobacteraceae bacterium]